MDVRRAHLRHADAPPGICGRGEARVAGRQAVHRPDRRARPLPHQGARPGGGRLPTGRVPPGLRQQEVFRRDQPPLQGARPPRTQGPRAPRASAQALDGTREGEDAARPRPLAGDAFSAVQGRGRPVVGQRAQRRVTPGQSATLGLVQGLAEFLPISSSAHLALFPWVFGWPDGGLAFDASLHLGTLLAAFGYYRRDWAQLFSEAARDPRSEGGRRLLTLAAATAPAAVAGLLLADRLETLGRFPPVPATSLIVFGLLLGLAARVGRRHVDLPQVDFKTAMLIGCAQTLALVPGVSRSGITITAALALGLTYEAAAKFSFLLAVPITFGAALHGIHKLHPSLLGPPFWIGLAASTLAGALAIKALLGALARWGVAPFVIYRLLAGAGILAIWLAR
ncbi:MAG: undecaprenyl-diphosphate phosphatase [Elusimicrobia bacterium]|nr:undecaprenyl-diphosphate phosphatase [Elusimicrobiota bacterium]